MPTIFDSGDKMMDAAFSFGAVQIDYVRENKVVASAIPAKLGKTIFRAENNYGVTIRSEQRDFIVRSSDLDITPEVGDEIHFDGMKYSVTAPNDEPCWKWHTRQTHSQKRIHTKCYGEIEHEIND